MRGYKNDALKISSIFFRYRNKIDIYTEDSIKDKEFYRRLFTRLLGSNSIIKDITPLGNKENVIKYCKADTDTLVKKIFIVDGDVKIINNKNESHENLFVLDRYCIENYIIDKKSSAKYIYNKCGLYSIEEIEEKLDFDNLMDLISEDFINLYFHYSILNSYDSLFKINYIESYFKLEEHKLKYFPEKVNAEILQLKDRIIQEKDLRFYEEKLREYKSQWTTSKENLLKIISGKDILMPLIHLKTKEIAKNLKDDKPIVTKINLVDHFQIESLDNLKQAILSKIV